MFTKLQTNDDPPHLVAEQQGGLSHRLLHILVRDEPVALWRLPRATATGLLEQREQPVDLVRVVLYELNGAVKLCAVLDGHTAVLLSRDDVVVLLALYNTAAMLHWHLIKLGENSTISPLNSRLQLSVPFHY